MFALEFKIEMQLRSEFLGYLYPDRLDRKEGGVLFDDGSVVVPGNLFVGENISALPGMSFRSITLKMRRTNVYFDNYL